MKPDKIRYNERMLRYFYQIITEIGLIIFYPILSLIVLFVPSWELRGQGQGKTIVIVERWLSINIRHLYWKYYLERKGYNVYLANFPLRLGDFHESAKHLDAYLERNELTDVTIVGISSGALTSFLYLHYYDGWSRVDKFISIGTPFQGTWMAVFLSWLRSGREVLPNSNLIREIQTIRLEHLDRVYCMKAKFDEMVPTGTILSGAHKITLNVIGHNNLHLHIRATYKKIMEIV
ncbi:MAG: hypothetical protein Q7T54_03115 [Candidatus Levybacteria bacterium]|nr:hypothetical protein [Candidatus Levybacteria bacterium]